MFDTVHWHHWNDFGYRVKTSKTHAIDTDRPNRTACGRVVPGEGNGIEVEGGESSEGWCSKCRDAVSDSLGFAIG